MDRLVKALEEKRGDTSVVKFAADLGVHFTTYYKWRKGERGIGPVLLKRVLRRYPDLTLLFLQDIAPSPEGE